MSGPQVRPHWHAAYDAQMALWRWYRTPAGLEWCAGAVRAGASGHGPATQDLVHRLWDGEMGRLLDCDPIYVSEEMCELVAVARETFAPEPLLETDLITPRGFLWFAKPILMPDRYGNPLHIHAFSWGREYAALSEEAATEAARRLHSDEAFRKGGDRVRPPEMERLLDEGLILVTGANVCLYAERESYLEAAMARAPAWLVPETRAVPCLPFHCAPWHFNQTFDGNEVDEDGIPSGMDQWWRLGQTTLRLMQQRVAHRGVYRMHRTARREAKRLGAPYEPETVVVRLRREQGESHEPTGESANYSHRFIVGGHWRNQPYPSEGIHRQIWIAPYVKGPEDKPLIVRPRRVYQWER